MREMSSRSHQPQDYPDARRAARSSVNFCGKLLDGTGTLLTDCTITNLSVAGAQVKLANAQPIPERLYLVDVTNNFGYEARIAWWRPHFAGLAFQAEYALGEDVPEQLGFLKSVAMEAKLALVESQLAEGKSLSDAILHAGMNSATYARLAGESARDRDFAETVWRLSNENASLRKLLSEKQEG